MLPTALVSVYQQYKADTDALASWLALTAKTAGCSPFLLNPSAAEQDTAPSGRLKGRARMLAKQQAAARASSASKKTVIAIDSFVPLAKFIAETKAPCVRVPTSILNMLDRAIHVRSTFSSRLSFHGAMPAPESDGTHSYFVTVLRQVSSILRGATKHKNAPRDAADTLSVENRFESLSVQEPSQAFLNAPDIEIPQADASIMYEAEPQTGLEDALAAYGMLLQDLNKIRYEIKEIWAEYMKGSIDVSAAAVATNTGVDLGRYLVDQVLPIFEQHHGIDAVAERFSLRLAEQRGYSTDNVTQFYEVADETMLIAIITVVNKACCEHCSERLNRPWDATHVLLRDILHKAQGQIAMDRNILDKLLFDIRAIAGVCPDYPVEDELLRGFKQLDGGKRAPFFVIFAAQVTLDVHHSMGSHAWEPAKQMQNELKFMHDLLDTSTQPCETSRNHMGCDCPLVYKDKVRWFYEDPFLTARELACKALELEPPPQIKHRTMWLSPILCGLSVLYFRAKMHSHSSLFRRCSQAILHAAHIYNALVQEKLVGEPWVDMQMIEACFGDAGIFGSGSTRPRNKDAYMKQLMLISGMRASGMSELLGLIKGRYTGQTPESVFSSRKPCTNKKRHVKDGGGGAPVTYIFIDRYINKSGCLDFRPEDIHEIISRGRNSDSSKAAARVATGRHSPDKLLQPLAAALTEESLELAFPYLLMFKTCDTLLTKIAKDCGPILQEMVYRSVDMPLPEDTEFIIPWYIFSAGIRNEAAGKEVFRAVADVVNELVASGAGRTVYDALTKEIGLCKEALKNICPADEPAKESAGELPKEGSHQVAKESVDEPAKDDA